MENQFNTSLWGDEGFSAILSMKPLTEIIRIIARDTSPPLYNITEHIAFKIFGTDEIVIRGLSFFYYLGAVFFVVLTTKHLWGKTSSIFAGLLTFLNPFFFIYAFEGRMYSIMALGVSASMYFFIRKKWIPYIIATLWAIYSHHFAFFALFVQGIWFIKELFYGNKKTARQMFKSFLAITVLYSPWLIPLYNQTQMVGGGFWLGTPNTEDLKNLIYEYLARGQKHQFSEAALYLVFFILILRNWMKNKSNSLFLVLWFILPILLTWVISQYFQSIFFNRYLLYTIPAAMIILATSRRGIVSNILIAILIVIFVLIDWHYFTHPTKRPFKRMSEYILQTKNENDLLINWDPGNHLLWESKYYGVFAPIYTQGSDKLPFFVGTALMEKGDLIDTLPEEARRVGVMTPGSVEDIKIDGYTEEERKEFGELKFLWLIKE